MPRYTFVLDFEGGTYLSQVTAPSPEEGRIAWVKQMVWAEIPGSNEGFQEAVMVGIGDETLTPLNGLEKVWCFSILPQERFGMVHVIES